MGNYHARCGVGEKPEVVTPEAYLSLLGMRAQIVRSKKKPVPIEEKKKSFWNII
jgi:hypothetical protein